MNGKAYRSTLSAIRYKTFGEAEQLFAQQAGMVEEAAEFPFRKQADAGKLLQYVILRDMVLLKVRKGPADGNRFLNGSRHELEKRKKKMGFNRKMAVGCLYPVAAAHPLHLGGKPFLVFVAAHVFNHAVRKHDVELPVGKHVHIQGVALYAPEPNLKVAGVGFGEVQQGYVFFEAGSQPHGAGAANIQDGAVSARAKGIQEQGKPALSNFLGE